MEEASGMKLGWFFRQWVYGAGYPKLSVKQTYKSQTNTLSLTVAQLQTADKATTPAFILPMEVQITTANGTKTEKIEIKKRFENFSLKSDEKPIKVVSIFI